MKLFKNKKTLSKDISGLVDSLISFAFDDIVLDPLHEIIVCTISPKQILPGGENETQLTKEMRKGLNYLVIESSGRRFLTTHLNNRYEIGNSLSMYCNSKCEDPYYTTAGADLIELFNCFFRNTEHGVLNQFHIKNNIDKFLEYIDIKKNLFIKMDTKTGYPYVRGLRIGFKYKNILIQNAILYFDFREEKTICVDFDIYTSFTEIQKEEKFNTAQLEAIINNDYQLYLRSKCQREMNSLRYRSIDALTTDLALIRPANPLDPSSKGYEIMRDLFNIYFGRV